MTLEQIAQAAHEANKAYCISIGDESQLDWSVAPPWQKESTISGVMFLVEHPEAGAEEIHENWAKEKLDAGWAYGPVKDAENKKHPCIMPYRQLPAEQQMKDTIFVETVNSLKAQLV